MQTRRLTYTLIILALSLIFAQSESFAAKSSGDSDAKSSTPAVSSQQSNEDDYFDDSPQPLRGWYAETRHGDFEAGLDHAEKHTGAKAAYLKSVVARPRGFGNLTQWFAADEYLGKRLRMTAWVKSEVSKGTAQLWLRIDGDWKDAARAGSFDNMNDRPIRGNTDWTRYSLVVDVPKTSTDVVFGLMLLGTGRVWLDDVAFEEVSTDVPLTGDSTGEKKKATNLDFELDE